MRFMLRVLEQYAHVLCIYRLMHPFHVLIASLIRIQLESQLSEDLMSMEDD